MQFAATCSLLEVRPMRLILPAHDAKAEIGTRGQPGTTGVLHSANSDTPVVRRLSTETNFDPTEQWAGSGIRPKNSLII